MDTNLEIALNTRFADVAGMLNDIDAWMAELDDTDIEDSIIYSTLDSVKDLIIDNLEVD